MTYRVLLVEDDLPLAEMVRDFLVGEDYEVTIEGNGRQAAARIASEPFDAVVLDIGLPGMDGFEVCRSVRPHFAGPIIVLTARGDEMDEVIALEVGADDFVRKPVRPRALLARMKSHLRRIDTPSSNEQRQEIVVDDLHIDEGSRNVRLGGEPIELSTAEFDLLTYLARRAGQVVPRKEIYLELLEIPYDGLDRSIDLRVSRLRRKLGDDPNTPERIKSIRGVGYLLAK
ncbi:MAG: response regulator transcription factor [Pirellulaceae bacterium]|nr:response regulator transcription factor [Pirellulaceae bacterium]